MSREPEKDAGCREGSAGQTFPERERARLVASELTLSRRHCIVTLGKRTNLSELQFEKRKPGVVVLPALERPRKDYTARHNANSFKQKSVLQGSGRSMGRKKGVRNRLARR